MSAGWPLLTAATARPGAIAMAASFAGMFIGQAVRSRMQPETFRRWFLIAMILLGERPGLGTGDGLSAYVVYEPRIGKTDGDRNMISNIHARGTPPEEAADRLAALAAAMIEQRTSGVTLDLGRLGPLGEAAIRDLHDAAPGGVDGLIDAAVLDAAVLPAIRDGGKLATVRGFAGPSERGITIEPVRVTSYLHNHEALEQLARLVAEKRLTLRVAETFPPEQAADAQRKMAAGGTRGRLLIVF